MDEKVWDRWPWWHEKVPKDRDPVPAQADEASQGVSLPTGPDWELAQGICTRGEPEASLSSLKGAL